MFDKEHYAFQSNTINTLGVKSAEGDFKRFHPFYRYFFRNILSGDKQISIVDMPCGHGNILYFLNKEAYKNVIGYDIDPGRVDMARALGLKAEVGDALQKVKEINGVDIIFSLDFIEHIEKSEALDFLRDCYHALSPGGKLIVRTPIADNLRGPLDLFNDITHKWAVNSSVLAGLFRQAGFTDILIKDERPQPYKFINFARLGVFYISKTFTNLFLLSLGYHPIKIWSSSCFFIGTK